MYGITLEIQLILEYSMVIPKMCEYGHKCSDSFLSSHCKYVCGIERHHSNAALRIPSFQITQDTRNVPVIILASSWTVGLLFGTHIAYSADSVFFHLMRQVPSESVSIVSLLFIKLLPYLFSAFAVIASYRWLFFIAAFMEAFLLSFVGIGVMLSFGQGGWVPALILMCCSSLGACAVLWFWIGALRQPVSGVSRRFILSASVFSLITVLDFRFFHPFLVDLLSILEG